MRAFNRFKTDQDVTCVVDGEKMTVGLYNLSCGGCMIEAPDADIGIGSEVQIGLNAKIIVPGHVVWAVDKNVGVKFSVPLHTKVVEHFGYENEVFDDNDPRDRFGIPLVEIRATAAGIIE